MKKRDDRDVCHAIYIPDRFTFEGPAASPQVFENGGVIVEQGGKFRGVQPDIFLGRALRYVGVIEADGRVSAKLGDYPLDHPFANLKGSDNVVSFQTARYNIQPMIVRGPGAGPEVTAAGVFADLLRLASFLGAPQ